VVCNHQREGDLKANKRHESDCRVVAVPSLSTCLFPPVVNPESVFMGFVVVLSVSIFFHYVLRQEKNFERRADDLSVPGVLLKVNFVIGFIAH
jgi:hypothetical protein